MTDWQNSILTGDCVDRLQDLPESSVHMCMTSPPYFGLRDYGVEGQIGLEDSLDQYIQEIVNVGDALRRVLRDDGSWWLNLGDTYGGDSIVRDDGGWTRPGDEGYEEAHTASYDSDGRRGVSKLGRKNKMLVPHRVAIALQDAGWVVRNDVTWVKPNPMPQSVKDRLNTTTEQIFHLTPKPDYWYDLDAIRTPQKDKSIERASREDNRHEDSERQSAANEETLNPDQFVHPAGKNPGDVFEVNTKPFPDAHFAVYPPKLCEKPIKATAPPKVCGACGKPHIRESVNIGILSNPTGREQKQRAIELFKDSELSQDHLSALRSIGFTDAGQAQKVYDGHGSNTEDVERLASKAKDVLGGYAREFIGRQTESTEWVQGCDCDTDETEPGIVLDPFAGAGTTLLKAKELGRRFVGIELNPEYADMARARIGLSPDDPANIRDNEDQSGLEAFTDGGSVNN